MGGGGEIYFVGETLDLTIYGVKETEEVRDYGFECACSEFSNIASGKSLGLTNTANSMLVKRH